MKKEATTVDLGVMFEPVIDHYNLMHHLTRSSDGGADWWVPIAAPLLGGIAGGGLYQLAIRPFLPARR